MTSKHCGPRTWPIPLILMLVASAALPGCPTAAIALDDEASQDDESDQAQLLATERAIIWPAASQLAWVELNVGSLHVERSPLPKDAFFVGQPRSLRDGAVALAVHSQKIKGRRENKTFAYRYLADKPDAPHKLELPAAFSQLAVSPSGRWALAYHAPGTSGGSLQSAGLTAVIDLQANKVHTLNLPGAVSGDREVIFPTVDGSTSATFAIDGREVELALVRSGGHLALIDLQLFAEGQTPAHPAQDLNFAQLLGGAVAAAKVRAPGGQINAPALFLLRPGAPDMAMVTLRLDAEADAGLATQLNLLQSQARNHSLYFYENAGRSYALTAGESSYLLTDLASGTVRTVPAGVDVADFAVRQGDKGPQLLAWSNQAAQVSVVELAELDSPLGARPSLLDIGEPVQDFRMIDSNRAMLATFSGLVFVDYARRETFPFFTGGSVDLAGALINDTHIYLRRADSQSALLAFSRADLSGTEVALNGSAEAMMYQPADKEVIVQHRSSSGTFTVLKVGKQGVEQARTYLNVVESGSLND